MNSEEQASHFYENFLFPKIFRTFRMAIQPSKLIIALVAIGIICMAGWLMDFSNTVAINELGDNQVSELDVYLSNPDRIESFLKVADEQSTGVFSTLWNFSTSRFHKALVGFTEGEIPVIQNAFFQYTQAIKWAFKYHPIYMIIFVLIKLVVMAVAGGAICRIAALQFAQEEKPGLVESVRYSIGQFINFFAAPLVPLGIIAVAGVCVLIVGLITNIPWVGELIAGLSIPLILLAGIFISLMVIGTVAGFNLMYPAIAYDGSDAFDAISRAFSYIYSRPWRMVFYTLVAAIYGAICYLFARFFVFLLLYASHLFMRIGVFVDNSEHLGKLQAIWPRPHYMFLFGTSDANPANWTQAIGAFLIYLGLLVVVGLLVAFIISFFYSANTIIYALMRNRVDHTPIEDVYTETEIEKDEQTIASDTEHHNKDTEQPEGQSEDEKPQI